MALQEEKLQVILELLRTENDALLEDVKRLIHDYKQDEEIPHAYANRNEVSFDEWIQQYASDGEKANVFLEEYGMTLHEFRKHMFYQERSSNRLD